ncbi:prepilin peptidase [Neorhizobium sp. T786]|uniref:A24 family peptidase n=1 Tax=Pseudorhizobium xiangyangii TaxID=2883104 RepID=UPI001CFFA0E4|nr:prepilin peptidase [Neorhizobium xiangyangii]MCB5201621.1 prepilin peptidase [Neorhizobium xiangyangii]
MGAAILLIPPICLFMAAVIDLFTMTIPNRLSIFLLASFMVLAPVSGLPWAEISMSFAAGAVVLLVCFGFFALNVMGGGDVKLLAASALWFGFSPALGAFIFQTALWGGLVTLLVMLIRSQADRFAVIGTIVPAQILTTKKVPYGVAIGIAGLMTFWSSPIAVSAMAALKQ